MNNQVVDLTNKIILKLDDYILLKETQVELEKTCLEKEKQYQNLLNYLFSECEIAKYTNGEKYLKYDNYNNHLGQYLKEIEPELYKEKLNEREEK